jgi:hypothetical protein
MSAPNQWPGLPNQTAAVAASSATEFDATECDKIVIMVTGVGLAGGETIQVFICSPDNVNIPVFDPTLTAAFKFTATSTRIAEFEGGFAYRLSKDATAGLVGAAVSVKRGQSN